MTLLEIGVGHSDLCMIPILLGIIFTFIFLIGIVISLESRESGRVVLTFFFLFIFSVFIAAFGGWAVDDWVDDPYDKSKIASAENRIESMLSELDEERFYLEPMAECDSAGKNSKSVLLIGGKIYGFLDDSQIVAVSYYDGDTIVDKDTGYNVSGFSLHEVDFKTIGAGERPYFQYNTGMEKGIHSRSLVVDGITLYLPEGWCIIG